LANNFAVTVTTFDYISEFTSIKVYGGYYRPLQKLLSCYSKEYILLQSCLLYFTCVLEMESVIGKDLHY